MKLIDRLLLAGNVIAMSIFAALFFLSPLYVWHTRPDGVMGEAEWILSALMMLGFALLFVLALAEYEDTKRWIEESKKYE